METTHAYIPMDRRQALAQGAALPDRSQGAALFADISGFTPLTEALVDELGPQRGAEELTRHLNRVYDALITELHSFGGSVIGFSGDAITCWLDGDTGLRATACALAMQHAMQAFASVLIPSGKTVSLAMKVAVVTGSARRFLAGDPHIQVIDALAGATLDRLAAAEHRANKGEVVLDSATLDTLCDQVQIVEWRRDDEAGQRFGVVGGFACPVTPTPWPPIPAGALGDEQVRPWLLPQVYERLRNGQGEFLAELRPAVALFLRFGGIDYDGDQAAGEKLDIFVRQVQHIFASYEGTLLQLMFGDKGSHLYAAFGAPVAHEDDAIRAAAAALELRALVPASDFITGVQIGISQGRMRTGAYGGAARRTYGVLGDEVNVAARLMQAAAPGQILASKRIQEAAADAFTWRSLPAIKVKGKAQSIPAFDLEEIKRLRATRLQAPQYTLPMVGREAELALIEEKLAQALQGQGQIVGITAEAGLGKSRLVAEIIRLANERQFATFGGECQSFGTNTPYLVWQTIWRGFFDLDPAWSLEEQKKALETQLGQCDASLGTSMVERLPLLGAVLNLPLPDNDLTRSLDAKLRKMSLEALLADCLRGRAGQTPLLFVLEDCHWLDPLSHDLLEVVGQSTANLPVVLVMAYRPPELHRLQTLRVSKLAHFSQIQLADFTPQEANRLIALKIARFYGPQREPLPAFVEQITSRAEGNPFYIEELLNLLHDRGLDPHDGQALAQLELPASLHSLILSRIDQLTESQKVTLKVASTIGRLFIAAWLWGAYPQLGEVQRIKADLEILTNLELTVLEKPEPELTYLFKHIITQEATYESLPYATRAMLHEQIGRFIERTSGESLDRFVDLLAYHYERSENEAKRREYLLKAGESAQANYANEAAIDYYRRLLPLLPEEKQIPVMLKLGQVLERVGQWQKADGLYRRALALAKRLDDRQAQARCQVALGDLLRQQGQYTQASLWLLGAQADFEELGDQAGVGQVLHYAGTLAAYQGNHEAARILFEGSLEIRRKLGDKPQIARLLNNLGIIARFQGNNTLARSFQEEALAIRRELRDKWAIAASLNNLGNVLVDEGDYATARERLEEAVALQRLVGDKWYTANSLNNLGNVVRSQGDYEVARKLYDESLSINRELGDRRAIAYVLEDIGCLAALQGQAQRALHLAGAASALRESTGAPLSPAEQAKLEDALEPARRELDQAAQTAALDEGKAMSLDQAIDYALSV